MATLEDVRRIALLLPEVIERIDGHRGGASWRTKRGIVVWERGPSQTDVAQLEQLGKSYPPGAVVGIRVDGLQTKETLLGAYPEAIFTIPHFDGYPAILVRLDAIDTEQLEELIAEAWLTRVAKSTAKQWLAEHGLTP